MNRNRTATIVVGAALLAWLAGAATSNHAIPPAPVVEPRVIESRGAELADEIARLHERLRPTSTPNQPGRNLFTFRSGRVHAVAPPVPAPAPAIVDAPLARPAQPSLKLAGIAEDVGPNGPERTAIISGDGQLFMVKEGDAVTLRYRVVKISADVVELTDLTDNSVRRLALK
jgi:hypothetical protein